MPDRRRRIRSHPIARKPARPTRAPAVRGRPLLLAACLLLPGLFAPPVAAAGLPPLTKVRLTIIQWVPLKGEYERWDAFSGEFVVSEEGALVVPVVGAVPVRDKSPSELAAEVAGALKRKLGLLSQPDASVEVLEFPPVYVVGEVATPGAFPYRPGMTVLQAFALGGGTRPESAEQSADRLRLMAELRTAEDGLLRTSARIARLQAEAAARPSIAFPEAVTRHIDSGLAGAVMAQEQAIFAARAEEMARQAAALEELGELLRAEISTLDTRMGDVDKSIAAAEKELRGVQSLVEQGMATVSRQSELERTVADLRFDRLTQITATLRARQALNESHRDAARLADARQTQIAEDLQQEEARLEQLALQRSTAQQLLLNLAVAPAAAPLAPTLTYAIVRREGGRSVELQVDETTSMLPGDVLKVMAGTPPGEAAVAAVAPPE